MGSYSVVSILLAAGESSRMGCSKPLLPWLGTTLVAFQVEQLLVAGVETVVVVLGHEEERVAAPLGGLSRTLLVPNPSFRQGKATSIRAGVAALPEGVEAILILGVDQPRRAETLGRLISAHRHGGSLITLPTYQGRRGHPPIFAAALRGELSRVDEERQGLREVVRRHLAGTAEVPVRTPEVLLDLNTPEEYRRALAFFGGLRTERTSPSAQSSSEDPGP